MLSKLRVGLFIYYSTHTIRWGKYHFCLYFKIFWCGPFFKLLNLVQYCFCFSFPPCGMWDLSCLTKDPTYTLYIERQSLSHWTTREVPFLPIFWMQKKSLKYNLFGVLWEPTPVFFPGKSCGHRSLEGYSPWGHKESDTTEWLIATKK